MVYSFADRYMYSIFGLTVTREHDFTRIKFFPSNE